MIDNKPEATEQPKPERIVKLGEEFQLFDPRYTTTTEIKEKMPWSSAKLWVHNEARLPMENGNWLHLSVMASPYTFLEIGFTPFDRESGYKVDQDDYDPQKRVEKMNSFLDSLHSSPESESKYPLLSLGLSGSEYSKLTQGIQNPFTEDTLAVLKKLKLSLNFPISQLRFEGIPSRRHLEMNVISFFSFYPSDFRPLPIPPGHTQSNSDPLAREGLSLYVPDDPVKLSQIRARFVIAPEESNEGGERL